MIVQGPCCIRRALATAARLLVLMAGVSMASGAAALAVTIDSFTTNQAAVADPPGTATVVTGGADILGTRRAINSDLLALPGTGIGAGPATTTVNGGALTLVVTGTTPDSRGEAIVTWDGDATASNLNVTGLAGQNLTASGHNALRLTVNSASAGTELVVDVYTSATAASRGVLRIAPAIAVATSLYLTYAYDFVPIAAAGADFSNVGAIQLRVRGTEVAASIDAIETIGPSVSGSKRDLDLANNAITAPQLEGTTFKYRLTVATQTGLATGVDLSDTVDANTALDAASIRVTPVAIDDTYVTAGHVGRSVAAPGLLANDVDPDTAGSPPELVVAAASVGTFATVLGGSITVAADGGFSYEPPVGVGRAVDTFAYTLLDNDGQTASGQVRFAIGPRVWFVDDAHPGTNVGTLNNPFVGFAAGNVNAVGGTGDVDAAGDIIVLRSGSHVASVLLEADEHLIGEGDGLTLDGQVVVVAGSDPVLSSPSHGIVLATNNTVRGLTVGNTGASAFDILGSGFGTLTVLNVDLTGTGGALSLTTGVLAASFGTVTSTTGTHGINLDGVSGTLAVSGATTLSDTSFGLRVNASGSLTATFSGTTSLTASAGTALFAATGGTLNFSGTSNSAVATNGPAVDLTSTSLGSGATFATVSATTNASKGINLDTVTGPFTGSGGAINVSSGGGNAVDVNAGASNVTYAGSVTSTAAARLVEVTSRTGGTVTLSGASSGTGAGHTGINVASNSGGTVVFSGASKVVNTGTNAAVTLASNSGATINFTGGGLDLDTTSGTGFNATGGATAITVQGSGNSITSTTGTALNVASTTIGASGLTFQSISANGAINGIVLNGTGALAGLTVTGSGTNNSGGILASSGQDAVRLSNTRSVSFTEMAMTNSGQSHIDASAVNGLTLINVDTDTSGESGIFGNQITNLTISGGTYHRGGAAAEPTCTLPSGAILSGVDITNLLGTSTVTGATFSRSNTIQFRVNNNMTTGADTLTVSGTTWSQHNGPCGGDHLSVNADSGANFKLITNGSLGENNFGAPSGNGGGSGIQATITGTGVLAASITGVETNHNTAGVALGAGAGATGHLSFDVYDNRSALGTGFADTGSVALILSCVAGSGGICEGAFRNNSITHSAGTSTNAMQVVVEGDGTGRVQVSGNQVTGNFQRGLQAQSRLGSGSLALQISSNTLTQTDANGLQVMNLEVGASGGGTTNSMCLNLANNTATPAGGNSAYRLFHRTGYTYQLQNLAQSSTTSTGDVATWVTTTKANGGTPVTINIGTTPFTSVPACASPILPTP